MTDTGSFKYAQPTVKHKSCELRIKEQKTPIFINLFSILTPPVGCHLLIIKLISCALKNMVILEVLNAAYITLAKKIRYYKLKKEIQEGSP